MEHISEILKRQPMQNVAGTQADADTDVEAEEPEPCSICKGARFVHPLLPDGKPDYGRVVPCRCTKQDSEGKRHSHLQSYSNLGPLTRLTFDNLVAEGRDNDSVDRQRFARAYEAGLEFASRPFGWLVLAGPSGSGKTHLAAAIANRRVADNHPAFYITTPDLLDHLRSSFNPNSDLPYDEFFEQVRNTPLLVLDDFGAQSATPWAREKMEQLLNHRFTNRLPTVIVTIAPIEELEERMRTRLADSDFCQVQLTGSRPSALSNWGWAPEFELQKEMTFDNFVWKRDNLPSDERQNLEKAYRLAVDFAKEPEGWLVFQGVNGCGKTHLAAAIVNYRYQQGKPALFIVIPDFLDHLRSTFSPDSKVSYDQLFESVKNAPLLVLDDLGAQTTTPWAQEKLYQVINHRYNARLATVITTNCSADEIDSRIMTRFVDQKLSMLFHIEAPDYFAGQKRVPRRPSRGR
ncbi:MAG: ATP-binding protein [Dehalococcoidales bacterium]|nr:MAG: ATP-binding protein [Dehalococcoidales bacterium]